MARKKKEVKEVEAKEVEVVEKKGKVKRKARKKKVEEEKIAETEELVDEIPDIAELVKAEDESGMELQTVEETNLEESDYEVVADIEENQTFLPDDLKGIDLKQKIQDLRRTIEQSAFDLGRVLYYIKINNMFKDWGYKSFSEYLKAEEAGHERRCEYLVNIHSWFVESVKKPVLIDELKSFGWARVKELASLKLDEEEEIEKWIEEIKDPKNPLSLSKLQKRIQETKNGNNNRGKEENDEIDPEEQTLDGDDKKSKNVDNDKSQNFSCKLYAEDYEIVQKALAHAKKITGSEVKGHNLSMVCMGYLSNETNSFEEDAEWFQKKHRVKIVAVDEDNYDNVRYGDDLLDGDKEEEE